MSVVDGDGNWTLEIFERCSSKEEWYEMSGEFWEKKEASVSGVLDGLETVTRVDLKGSLLFLSKVEQIFREYDRKLDFHYALDCGAGIGRVSKGCLLKKFSIVDLIDQAPHLLDEARAILPIERVGNFFCSTVQEFVPPSGRYDCIWMQWCCLYLTDSDLIKFLRKCIFALKPEGVICIKENYTEGNTFIDWTDCSVMRTQELYRSIMATAGLEVVLEMKQPGFPSHLHPVTMICAKPIKK